MSRPWLYILDDAGNPTPALDIEHWVEWHAQANGQLLVLMDTVKHFSALTRFIGIDQNHSAAGAAVLYETQVWSEERPRNEHTTMRHSATRAEAEASHWRTVGELTARIGPSGSPDKSRDAAMAHKHP